MLGSVATEFDLVVAAQEADFWRGDCWLTMVLNILLDAVTLISQDCSKKRAMGSKNSLSLQEEKLSIKFECHRIHWGGNWIDSKGDLIEDGLDKE